VNEPLSKETRVSRKHHRWIFSPDYDRKWIDKTVKRCVVTEAGCWEWQGFRHKKGYGNTAYRGRGWNVHRAMYRAVHGVTLTPQQFVLHRCDNPPCCNPNHLFLGNNDINMADKTRKGRHHEQSVTHCPRGHEYNAQNTYRAPSNPNARGCKLCQRIRQRIKSGWPVELAESHGRVPFGHRIHKRAQA
jgi:hypothetical protein